MHTGIRLRWRPDDPAPAGSPASCRWFVDIYSDYRDGHLGPDARARAEVHLEACSSCRRYDRVIRAGISTLRADDTGGSDGFLAVATVRDQAWALDREEAMALGEAGSGITTAGVVVVALLLGAFAWFPFVMPGMPEVETAPVAAAAPAREPIPAYAWGDPPPARLSLPSAPGFSMSAPRFRSIPSTPGVAVGVDPD